MTERVPTTQRASRRTARRDVIAVVGAGPGVGASVAHRFAREGFGVALVARNESRLRALAEELRAPGRADTPTAVAVADATDPAQLRAALESVAADLGAPTALCFSPLPDVGLIKPVLETRPEDFMSSLQLNVAGAVAAVESVLPSMLDRGHGSLLFTTGSAALAPQADRAASAVTTTATTLYLSLLHDALVGTGVRVGHTVVVGPIGETPDSHHPDTVADDLWRHHTGRAAQHRSVLRST